MTVNWIVQGYIMIGLRPNSVKVRGEATHTHTHTQRERGVVERGIMVGTQLYYNKNIMTGLTNSF